MSTQAPIVKVQNLVKTFNKHTVVDHLSFEVYAGECLGILGPNGAGKTTTLRCLLGMVLPEEGYMEALGFKLPHQSKKMRAFVGVVPQQDNLDTDFTVEVNLITYGSYFGLSRAKIMPKIKPLLHFAALEEKAKTPVDTLSGGMKRRLILARALINDPSLLILDEPTTGLDPQARRLIWQRLRSLLAEKRTLILTTHYMEEAERLCDRIILIDRGKILDTGSPRELVNRHIEPHVIEVYGNHLNTWQQQVSHLAIDRQERVGETLFCYCQDERSILTTLHETQNLRYLHRRANLEDVFVKLTGRELRDG